VLSNPRSDRVRSVARLSGRSARQRAGRFLAEGPQAVREAVAASSSPLVRGGTVRELYSTEEAAARYPEILAAAPVEPRRVTPEVLAAMVAGTGTTTPQGLVAVCDLTTTTLDDLAAGLLHPDPPPGEGQTRVQNRPLLVAVLSRVRDPGNAGTVIRVADAAGADAVVLTDASVDVHNPKTVRATAGSLFHLPVVSGVALEVAAGAFRKAGLTVLAADGAGDTDLDDLEDAAAGRGDLPASLSGAVAWIFGNEAWGLPEQDRALADLVVRVPIHGRAESLNLATAAAVCLYATARAHRAKTVRRV
jgi:RNA methyltransferase, TrmH family